MYKYILKYGLIVGAINALGLVSMIFTSRDLSFDYSELMGYLVMLIAFSFIYLGTKKYRDEAMNGVLSFGKALQLGLLMSLVAATFYVITWIIVYYGFVPDFMERYSNACITKMTKSGASEFDIAEKVKEINQVKEMYKNPFFVVLITYSEILPVGILVSFVTSLVLRKKAKV